MIDIVFRSKKLKKFLESHKECTRAYGPENALKIIQRINELKESENLLEFKNIYKSSRLHPLKGKRKKQFAIDVKHPFRIIIEPIVSKEAYKEDDSIDLLKVNKVRIIEVVDYHD